jgi:hypothetical protein
MNYPGTRPCRLRTIRISNARRTSRARAEDEPVAASYAPARRAAGLELGPNGRDAGGIASRLDRVAFGATQVTAFGYAEGDANTC